jgi:hypothetical protein
VTIVRKSLLKPSGASYSRGWEMPAPEAGLEDAQNLRSKVAGRYDEAVSYAMPGRSGIVAGPDQSQIYDDTAVVAVPEFASRVQQGVTPTFSQWASYVAGILIEDGSQKDDLVRALERVDKYRFELINSSNFALEAGECFLDLALGTFAMRCDEGFGANPLNFRALPLSSVSFGIGPDGRPDPIYQEEELTLNAFRVRYPDAHVPADLFNGDDPKAKYKFVEAWHRDWSAPAQYKYRRSVFCRGKDNATLLTEWHHGDGCCPITVVRWNKAAGEGWGRGPLFNMLPSMRKANYAERALLDHFDIAIAGIWTLEDDGILNPDTVRLEAGSLLPVAAGSQGLKNVSPGAKLDFSQFLLEETRGNIRKGLYTEQLGNPNKTPMSATEVTQRMAELARAVGSPFARIIIEFVLPIVIRVDRILMDRGLIKLPQVDGKKIKLIATSPLAQAQRFEVVEALDRYAATLQARLGPEMTNVVIDGTEFADTLAEALQVPKKVNRPPAKQQQIVAALTNAAAQQQGAASGGGPESGAAGGSGAPA